MKTKSTYTPGPWNYLKVVPDYRDPLFSHVDIIPDRSPRSGIRVARASGIGNDEALANARLIAVAPELLETLKKLREAFYVDGTSKTLRKVFEESKSVMLKAEGK